MSASQEGNCQHTYAGEKSVLVPLGDVAVRFDERGLIPAVVQQHDTGEVLMVAWMSEESLALTLKTGTTWFWSRSRQELWNKGATSGNVQQVKRVLVDCDAATRATGVASSASFPPRRVRQGPIGRPAWLSIFARARPTRT